MKKRKSRRKYIYSIAEASLGSKQDSSNSIMSIDQNDLEEMINQISTMALNHPNIARKTLENVLNSRFNSEKVTGKHANTYIGYYTKEWLLDILNGDKLSKLENKFKEYEKDGVDLVDFVRLFLEVLEANKKYQVFHLMAIVDLFQDISGRYLANQTLEVKKIKFNIVTDYLIEKFTSSDEKYTQLITKKLPNSKYFHVGQDIKIRDIDLNAPVIKGADDQTLKKLNVDHMVTDHNRHFDSKINR